MKFWQKLFLATFALFLVAFDIGLFLIADFSYKNSIESEKNKDLGEHYFISVTLAKDVNTIQSREGQKAVALKSLFDTYGEYYRRQGVDIAVILDGEYLYSNLPESAGALDFYVQEGERNMQLRNVDEGYFIFISGQLPEPDNDFTLIYSKNLDSIVNSQKELTKTLLAVSVLISVALAAALYLLLRHLSQPIRRLTESTQLFAGGKYNERVRIKGKDELARLGEGFNEMAGEIENKIKELEDASMRKQQFIDNLAHELRTPLTSISGYAEYIQKASITDDDKYTATSYIISESNRLKEIAYKLMDMAILRETGIEQKELDISDLVDKACAVARVYASGMDVVIKEHVEHIGIRGDEDLLRSLLVNLIDNAVKACESGCVVKVSSYYDGDEPCIEVADNGKGMTKEQMEHITLPFYRVDKARSRQGGGAGLGLSLCQQIAESHNARLEFYSEEGRGTRAVIRFYGMLTMPSKNENSDDVS